jgi:hypothetical protein
MRVYQKTNFVFFAPYCNETALHESAFMLTARQTFACQRGFFAEIGQYFQNFLPDIPQNCVVAEFNGVLEPLRLYIALRRIEIMVRDIDSLKLKTL